MRIRAERDLPRAGRPGWRPALALLGLGALLGAPAAAFADPLQVVLHKAALQETSVVLDDAVLSGIRGRGAEGLHVSAAGSEDIAVILWDEQNRRQSQGQQDSGISRSTGHGNVQANSLVTRRY